MPTKPAQQIDVYLEVGAKKTFAGAIDWPGWARSAKDEEGALAALLDYAPRYAKLFARTKVDFAAPDGVAAFKIVERMKGDSSTEFGVPGQAPQRDEEPFGEPERERAEAILAAIWRAFDRAVEAAAGKELRKGPRGGGRETEAIVGHVLGADGGYLRAFGQKFKHDEQAPHDEETQRTRAAIRAALRAAAAGEIPERGPRGGKIWLPHYYVRRAAWHTLDHAWEIENRIE